MERHQEKRSKPAFGVESTGAGGLTGAPFSCIISEKGPAGGFIMTALQGEASPSPSSKTGFDKKEKLGVQAGRRREGPLWL